MPDQFDEITIPGVGIEPELPELPDELIDELLAGARTPEEIAGPDGLLNRLTKRLIERAMDAELTDHLGYERGSAPPGGTGNSRNGITAKTVHTQHGSVRIEQPRDRQSSFEPQIVGKRQRRFTGFDERIIAMYARGMSVRDIQAHLAEIYGVQVGHDLVSRVTDAVLDDVRKWQTRPLEDIYPILFLDALIVKVRDGGAVRNRACYVAIGVNLDGARDVLGLWFQAAEGAKFWLQVLTELKQRGVRDVLVCCVDGLKGFPEAIEAVFPQAWVQTCIVHLIRHSLRFVPDKYRRQVAKDLKPIYTAANADQALQALEQFEASWSGRYPMIGQSWRDAWEHVTPFLAFPDDLRRVVYTTNTIEALHRQMRKNNQNQGTLPDRGGRPQTHLPRDHQRPEELEKHLQLELSSPTVQNPLRRPTALTHRKSDTLEVLAAAMSIGAAVARLEEFVFSPMSVMPNGGLAMHNADRTKPGAIIVDANGDRFTNEAANYQALGHAIYEHSKEAPAIPSWLILDGNHRRRYPLFTAPPGRTPQEWIDTGYLKVANTIDGLARACDVDATKFAATVERFNAMVRAGHDDDFGRGDNPYEYYYGDPSNKPNPTLGELSRPPFYAVALYPGDLGSWGGLVTDEHARVLREDGEAIAGLYAAGNITAPLAAGEYWGGGATVGSSMTFGYGRAPRRVRWRVTSTAAVPASSSIGKLVRQEIIRAHTKVRSTGYRRQRSPPWSTLATLIADLRHIHTVPGPGTAAAERNHSSG